MRVASINLRALDCGEPVLNEWLKRRAFANQMTGASRTFVVVGEHDQVLAYCALAAGAIALSEAVGSVRRNMPPPLQGEGWGGDGFEWQGRCAKCNPPPFQKYDNSDLHSDISYIIIP